MAVIDNTTYESPQLELIEVQAAGIIAESYGEGGGVWSESMGDSINDFGL